MNKLAYFINHYRMLGAQAATQDIATTTKTANLARFIPKSRIGRLGTAAGVGGAGLAGINAMRPEPSMMDSIGDSINSMSQEDLMGYASLLGSMGQGGMGGYSGMMGYQAIPGQALPIEDIGSEYEMSDIGEFDTGGYDDEMGYSRPMSPEEEMQYLSYYGG
jgi:hypothetical protein